jgi:predicted dehydrogenase
VAKETLRAEHAFTDYDVMLTDGGCTAVVIGSPMHLHVAQSIAALERGVHVLCEVTAGVTIEECRDLVVAAERSDALFMMAENINYDRTSVLINSIVDAGKMGDVRAQNQFACPLWGFGHTLPSVPRNPLCCRCTTRRGSIFTT